MAAMARILTVSTTPPVSSDYEAFADDIQELYLKSLAALGLNPLEHDIRFVEDNWESPTLGAWGMGWEVWLDGMEITQFTYFQQIGGLDARPVSVEITYGLERIAMFIQEKDNVFDVVWVDDITYGDISISSRWSIPTTTLRSLIPKRCLCSLIPMSALQLAYWLKTLSCQLTTTFSSARIHSTCWMPGEPSV